MKTLIAIPVFNEEKSLRDVVSDTAQRLSGDMDRIVLINDGSTDSSHREILRLCEIYDSVELIHHEKNRGYGASMIDALSYGRKSGYDYVITMDCDRQHRPEDLSRFLRADPEIDVLSGSRYLPDSGDSGSAPVDRVEINSRIVKRLNRKFGWSLTDAFCGYKRYRLKNIEEELFLEKGYAFPLEFWPFAYWKKLSVQEIAVKRIYTTDDRSFGEDLDRKRKRYRYYLSTFSASEKRFQRMFSGELSPCIH